MMGLLSRMQASEDRRKQNQAAGLAATPIVASVRDPEDVRPEVALLASADDVWALVYPAGLVLWRSTKGRELAVRMPYQAVKGIAVAPAPGAHTATLFSFNLDVPHNWTTNPAGGVSIRRYTIGALSMTPFERPLVWMRGSDDGVRVMVRRVREAGGEVHDPNRVLRLS